MARYNMPKPMSMYRDTGLVDITKEFRNRYVQNMAADNSLSKAVLEMAAREQDQEAKQRLMEKYNTQLQQRSESGNYHMLGNDVVRDAQNFMKEYQPIKQEKQAYDQWLQGLTEQRDAFVKTGKGVDPFTYQAKISEANYTYKGLQFNPDGSAVETSRAKLPGYVGYVDVESRIIAQMKDVVMSEVDTTGMEYGLGADGGEIEIEKGIDPNTKQPAYYMKSGSYVKQLDAKIVSSVVNRVLNQPDTKAYNQQTSYLENFTKDRINTNSGQSLASDEIDARLLALDGEIAALENKKPKNRKEKENLEAEIKYKENLEEFILESRDKGLDDLNTLIALSSQTRELNIMDAAIIKYAGVKSEKYVRDYSESSRYNQSLKDGGGASTIKFRVGADGLQTEVLGGTDVDSKQEMFETAKTNVKKDVDKYGEDFVNLASTGPGEKQTMEEYYDNLITLSGGRLTKESVKIARQRIQDNNQIQELITLQLDEAFASEFKMTKEEYAKTIEDNASNLNGSYDDVLELEGQNFDINMNTIASAFSQLGKANLSNGEMLAMLDNDKQFKNKVITFIATNNFKSADYSDVDEQTLEVVEGDIRQDFINETGNIIEDMVDSQMTLVNKGKDKISKFLDPKKDIATDALIIPSFNDPTNKTTVKIKNLFKEGLPENFALIAIGEDGTETKTTYNELVEKEDGIFAGDKPPTIVKDQMGLVAVSRPDGKPLILIPFKNEEGKIDNYYAEYDQIQAPSMNAYVNSGSFRLTTMYRNGIHANVQQWAPKLFEGSVIFNYSGGPEEKVIANGISMGVEEGLKAVRLFLQDKGQDL
tara:strand:- start:4436 stop:6889 length:2454 start_codon:yes stop_codon:yes gene_type:complete